MKALSKGVVLASPLRRVERLTLMTSSLEADECIAQMGLAPKSI